MAEGDLRHFFLESSGQAIDYTSKQTGRHRFLFPERNRQEHGAFIKRKLEEAWNQAREKNEERKAVSMPTKDGLYLEFESAPEYELVTKSLENRSSGVRLLNVKTEIVGGKSVRKATVFIPSGKENLFLEKAQAYLDKETGKNKKPRNQPLIESLNNIKLAVLESFWQGKNEWIPAVNAEWCEIWLSSDSEEAQEEFRKIAEEDLEITLQKESLKFPERRVVLGKANREQLQELITASPHIAEIRRASETAEFVEMENREQTEWAEELLKRIQVEESSNVCICILDTGVNNGHMLLKPILSDGECQSYDPEWGTYDHEGHGTRMSGLAGYGDLESALLSNSPIQIPHRLESIKILPPKGENDPKLYGAIVTQSVSSITVDFPDRKRILCMAVTSPKFSTEDGSPSSWSASIDELTSGYLDETQKLIFISAGNVDNIEDWGDYPVSNKTRTVQNPGQSWNAITVGAYTEKTEVDGAKYGETKAIACKGGLSPYSPTSCLWDKKWPIKPDIVLEGGNLVKDQYGSSQCSELSLLTLNHRPHESQFSTLWATSAATAQAAWMASQIQTVYPHAWPETIRALLIHSADWTEEMKRQFLQGTDKSDYHDLLRVCGFGVPKLQKALWCAQNSVNLVIQSELQPYDKKPDGSGYKTKDMHIHELPWPKEDLLALGETPVTLKITLSYFIEPGPGEIGWKDRYRYPSCLLRFDVNGTDSREVFLNRINKAANDEENETATSDGGGLKWVLGKQNRHKGSIHSDKWNTTAAQLATSSLIGIYPAIGWWRERHWLGSWDKTVRYALVVTVETPENDVDLYTPILAKIKTLIPITVI